MPNKRFQLSQQDGQLTRTRRKNLKAHPMSPLEAARFLCQAHTARGDDAHGFVVEWHTPDFNMIDGDLYWEAWRALVNGRVSIEVFDS
jgi:hypothetical protein